MFTSSLASITIGKALTIIANKMLHIWWDKQVKKWGYIQESISVIVRIFGSLNGPNGVQKTQHLLSLKSVQRPGEKKGQIVPI